MPIPTRSSALASWRRTPLPKSGYTSRVPSGAMRSRTHLPVLLRLLADSDWRVRAQAARALGALRCSVAVAQLTDAVRDPSWWVRYRSALALAQIGGPARSALMELTHCDDRMACDMSTLVAGLSSAAVIEMSEV